MGGAQPCYHSGHGEVQKMDTERVLWVCPQWDGGPAMASGDGGQGVGADVELFGKLGLEKEGGAQRQSLNSESIKGRSSFSSVEEA